MSNNLGFDTAGGSAAVNDALTKMVAQRLLERQQAEVERRNAALEAFQQQQLAQQMQIAQLEYGNRDAEKKAAAAALAQTRADALAEKQAADAKNAFNETPRGTILSQPMATSDDAQTAPPAQNLVDPAVIKRQQAQGLPVVSLFSAPAEFPDNTTMPPTLMRGVTSSEQKDDLKEHRADLRDAETNRRLDLTQANADRSYALQQQKLDALIANQNKDFRLTDDDVDLLAQKILRNEMAPSQVQLVAGMGKAGVEAKQRVMRRIGQIDPNFNLQAAESQFSFGKSAGTQNTVRYIDNVAESIPLMISASDAFKRANVKIVNAPWMAAQRAAGDTTVVAYDMARTMLADEIGKIFQGGGSGNGTSDMKLKQAQEMLAGDMTPDQIRAVAETVKPFIENRRKALTSGTWMANKPSASTPAAPTTGLSYQDYLKSKGPGGDD